jgi:hypothetical protein
MHKKFQTKSCKEDTTWDMDDIKIDVTEIGCKSRDWIQLPQERVQWQTLVHMVMNLWVL